MVVCPLDFKFKLSCIPPFRYFQIKFALLFTPLITLMMNEPVV